jgi:hypothetical protein
VQAVMRQLKAHSPGLGPALAMWLGFAPGFWLMQRRFCAFGAEAGEGGRYANLSNFGVLAPSRLDFGAASVIDAYAVGPAQYAPGFLLVASSFRDTLTLSTGFCADAVDPATVEQVLERLIAELTPAVRNSAVGE